MTSDIFNKLNKFESDLVNAWVYDTKLDYQENVISGTQIKKFDEYHQKAKIAKAELVEMIKELINA